MGDIDTGNEETDDARDTADYQRIATIYEAISQYRSELRKLQTLQRQDIRLNIKSSKPKVNTKDYHFYLVDIYICITDYTRKNIDNFSDLAYEELDEALYSLLGSIALLLFMLVLGPLIFVFNRNVALLGEVSHFT